jgi:hypothetical protein
VLDNRSPAWNKGRAWIDGAKGEVVEAYAKQSEEDLESFLRCRKEEIVRGGILFMVMGGRPRPEQPENQLGDPDSRAKHPFTTSMDQAWKVLLNEVSDRLSANLFIFYIWPLSFTLHIFSAKRMPVISSLFAFFHIFFFVSVFPSCILFSQRAILHFHKHITIFFLF